jgi:hypothetical protein
LEQTGGLICVDWWSESMKLNQVASVRPIPPPAAQLRR